MCLSTTGSTGIKSVPQHQLTQLCGRVFGSKLAVVPKDEEIVPHCDMFHLIHEMSHHFKTSSFWNVVCSHQDGNQWQAGAH